MTPGATLDAVRRALERDAEPAYRAKIAELVPTGIAIIGVRVPAIRKHAQTWHRAHGETSADDAIDLLAAAFARRCREEILFAIAVLARMRRSLTPRHLARLDPLIDRIEDWEVCDQLAMGVIGPIVAADAAETSRLERWAGSRNPWRRRAAVAATTGFSRESRDLAGRALAVCGHLMTEKDAGVKKAVGWALREACKADAAAVFEFLLSWKGRAERRILNEGSQKLSPTQRKRLL